MLTPDSTLDPATSSRPGAHLPPRPAGPRELMTVGCVLAELIWLAEQYGTATPHNWHARIRPELPQEAAERQFERVKAMIRLHGVPHETVSLPRMKRGHQLLGIRLRITTLDVDVWAERIKVERVARSQALRSATGQIPAVKTLRTLARRQRALVATPAEGPSAAFARAS